MDVFGAWLTAQLDARGLKWADLAEATGLTVSAVTSWGRGETMPRRRHVPAIARLLRVPQTEVYQALGVPMPYKRGENAGADAALALFDALSPEEQASVFALMRGLLDARKPAAVPPASTETKGQ